jgi:hypothetical protein
MNGTLEVLLAAHTFLCDREEQPGIAKERTLVQTQICEARGADVAQDGYPLAPFPARARLVTDAGRHYLPPRRWATDQSG